MVPFFVPRHFGRLLLGCCCKAKDRRHLWIVRRLLSPWVVPTPTNEKSEAFGAGTVLRKKSVPKVVGLLLQEAQGANVQGFALLGLPTMVKKGSTTNNSFVAKYR
jgi:hypothetical protein